MATGAAFVARHVDQGEQPGEGAAPPGQPSIEGAAFGTRSGTRGRVTLVQISLVQIELVQIEFGLFLVARYRLPRPAAVSSSIWIRLVG